LPLSILMLDRFRRTRRACRQPHKVTSAPSTMHERIAQARSTVLPYVVQILTRTKSKTTRSVAYRERYQESRHGAAPRTELRDNRCVCKWWRGRLRYGAPPAHETSCAPHRLALDEVWIPGDGSPEKNAVAALLQPAFYDIVKDYGINSHRKRQAAPRTSEDRRNSCARSYAG
jgi:hypothetical protein